MNDTLRSSDFGAGQARDDVGRPGAAVTPGDTSALERRLRSKLGAEVAFDRFTRGRYATDASHYQIVPLGVAVPRTIEEAEQAIEVAKEYGVSVTDSCVGWETTVEMVKELATAVRKRRATFLA